MTQLSVWILKAVAFLSFLGGILAAVILNEAGLLFAFGASAGGFVAFAVLWAFASITEDLRRIAGEPDRSKQWTKYGFPNPQTD